MEKIYKHSMRSTETESDVKETVDDILKKVIEGQKEIFKIKGK